MEDLKDWYYRLTNVIKSDKGIDEPAYIFDAEHEKKRKEQLELLWNRTAEEVGRIWLIVHVIFLDKRRGASEEPNEEAGSQTQGTREACPGLATIDQYK